LLVDSTSKVKLPVDTGRTVGNQTFLVTGGVSVQVVGCHTAKAG
jgi:hypothetical protein